MELDDEDDDEDKENVNVLMRAQRPSEMWEVVMEDIPEETGESQGTVSSLKSVLNSQGSSEFGSIKGAIKIFRRFVIRPEVYNPFYDSLERHFVHKSNSYISRSEATE